MSKSNFMIQASGLVIATVAAGCLTACQQNSGASNVAAAPPPAATIPLADTPTTGPVASAPPVQALPAYSIRHAAPARPQDAYAFAERARYASYGYGDAPPDYGFDYNGVRPWAWQGDNGYTTVVEPLPDGDRYYYYAPGDDTPYYVRDPDYAYGYQGGVLVVVYDRYGHPLPDADAERWWDDGGRYFRRGEDLWRASRGQHYAVERAHWQQRRDDLDRDQAWWGQAEAQNPEWQSYDTQYGGQYQNTWRQERYRREAEAYRVDQAYNDGARAQREHDQALVAVGVAGAATGLLAGGLFGHHEKTPPEPAVASAPPPAQAAGAKPAFGGLPPPSQSAGLKSPLPPAGGPATAQVLGQSQALAQRDAALRAQQQAAAAQEAAQRADLAKQESALMAQKAAANQSASQRAAAAQRGAALMAQQQAVAQQAANQRAEMARQEAALKAQQQAAAQGQAPQAAEQRLAAQGEAQRAAAQQAAAARQQAAAQAQFKAEEARVARIQAQQAQSAAARQAQVDAQQRAESARAAQVQAAQKAEAARLTLVQSQQHAEAARQAQVQAQAQAQQHAAAARQAQLQAQQAQQKANAAARAKAAADQERGSKPGNPTP